jgi:two-component system, OmpR family, sensor kinase
MRGGLRRRLMLLVALGAALTLIALTAAFNLALRASLDSDANRLLDARAQAALQTLKIDHGEVTVRGLSNDEAPDTQAWVFAGGKVVQRPPATTSLDLLARSLAAGPETTAEDGSTDTRLHAVPIAEDGTQLGTVVSAISVEPYERTAKRALLASVIFSAIVFALILIAARLVIARALRPVAKMTSEAADWSEHDLDHRFNAGEPYDELTRLAATFDSMLERLAVALRHEQRFSAELSHELRTPLAAIVTEAELALRRERSGTEYRTALERISTRSRQLQQVLETLLIAAREEVAQPAPAADARAIAMRTVDGFAELAAEHGVSLESTLPERPLTVEAGPATVERILAPVIENACLYGRSSASLELSSDNGTARFAITDDGPGIADRERETVFEPGGRGAAGRAASGVEGSGLGLALARRLARAVGGDVRAAQSTSGARLEVSLPRARDR